MKRHFLNTLALAALCCSGASAQMSLGKYYTQGTSTIILTPWSNRPLGNFGGVGVQIPPELQKDGVMVSIANSNPMSVAFRVTLVYRTGDKTATCTALLVRPPYYSAAEVFTIGREAEVLSVEVTELTESRSIQFQGEK